MVDKKIYTLTCTWPRNYGAVLQTYALVKFLRTNGYDAQTINYKPYWWKDSVYDSRAKKLIKPIAELVGMYFSRPFVEFLRDDEIITKKVYRSNIELGNSEFVAGAFIVGSDQVWNCTKYYNGLDDAMFLDFAMPGQKRISYAASLAMPDVPQEQAVRYKRLLDKFDAVSVREKTGKLALENIGVQGVEVLIDPVYLVSDEEWFELANRSRRKASEKKYVLVVCLEERDELYEYARSKADMLGVELYSFRGGIKGWKKHTRAHRNFWNISVYDYLNLIRNAEAIVTDSFHAMSFSLIFNRDVDILPRNDNGNSRMSDLLDDFDASERITTSDKLLTDSINYEELNLKMMKKIDYASKFLDDTLEVING